MQTTSLSYSSYPTERQSNMRVVFQLVDVDAFEDATPSATSEAEISKIEQTHDEITSMSKKLATLEQDYFKLDGTFKLPSRTDNGQVGWWSSALSGPDSIFAPSQVLEFNFTESQSSVGFTIIFDDKANEVPSDFTIQTYDGSDTLLSEDIVVGNTNITYVSSESSDGYEKVRLTFTKTSKPYRRVRVCEVIFGIIQIFDNSNTSDLNIIYEINPSMDNLPTNELSITLDNVDRKYNMINPSGLYSYLQQGQEMDVQIGVGDPENVELVNMGRFYFNKSEAEDDSMTAEITANDKIIDLEGSICRIGTDGTWTVADAVAAVISDSGLAISTSIPSLLGARIINKCIPQNVTHREALRLIAQASMSVCYFNRDDELVFVELAEGPVVDTLNSDNMLKPAKISIDQRINTVEIVSRNEYTDVETIYIAANKEAGETDKIKSITNPLANSNDIATWLLGIYQSRAHFELSERGNPATELADTIKIHDAYGENKNGIIEKQEFSYDGSLKATTKGRLV